MTFFSKHKKSFFLILTILAGLFILSPYLDFQVFVSPGDHGRDLYAAEKTLEGHLPYKDYWWVYGPLMPYFYAIFFKIFGVSIKSILIGKIFLVLCSGIFFYLTLSLISSPLIGFLGATWFFIFNLDPFFTYNHVGGITVILALIYCLFLYFQTTRTKYLVFGYLLAFILSLIKINFGLVGLFNLFVLTCLLDKTTLRPQKKLRLLFLTGATSLCAIIVFIIYYALLKDLPLYAIRQCLPYLSVDHPNNISVLQGIHLLFFFLKNFALHNTINLSFIGFMLIACIQTIAVLLSSKTEAKDKKYYLLSMGMIVLFFITTLHEFIVSGVLYRLLWPLPFLFLLIFYVIYIALLNIPRVIRLLFYLAISLIMVFQIILITSGINKRKSPSNYFPLDKAKVYIVNSPDWIKTVVQTSNFIKDNLSEEETFFALPYDVLYYYLTDKTAPTRQLIFFDHINIPQEQELKIIRDLQDNNTSWILISSRAQSSEKGMGTFGATYCPVLAQYIMDNYNLVAEFGDWTKEGGWAWNHGTRIYKRK